MKEGLYLSPSAEFVLIEWAEGPGFNTGCLMWTVGGNVWLELGKELKQVFKGFEYLGKFE